MHPHPPLADTLLNCLGREEALLRDALATAARAGAALRRGDLAAAFDSNAQQQLAGALREAADLRAGAATALAHAIGSADETPTLAALGAKLPDPHASELLAARDRLTALAAEVAAVQARNANLITHLRSFFRGVLSELTAPGAPARYGPSGSRLEPAAGAAVQARG